jgi:voltage-gated potassium channel
MFVIENGVNEKFDSIPRSIYWAIITVTTVGYGDISPVTTAGQFVAAFTMLIGYAVLAVPTGIMTSTMLQMSKNESNTINCKSCGLEGHATDAVFCRKCGTPL